MSAKRLLIAIALLASGFLAGYYVGRLSSALPGPAKEAAQAPVTPTRPSPLKATFFFPGSVQLPEHNPQIRCDFRDPPDETGFAAVTVTNLADRSYSLDYRIYGYDTEGRRVSEGEDEFVIGRRESVVRKVLLISQATASHRDFGTTFSVQMTLKE
jgi:hypothetical protein